MAEAPRELNKTRGIGIIEAPPDFVAGVIADDYESWDSTIKELKILQSERDAATGALVEVIWSRYCLRERLLPRMRPLESHRSSLFSTACLSPSLSACFCFKSSAEVIPAHLEGATT